MQPNQAPPLDEHRSLGELLTELSQQTTTLLRKEVALAKSEASESMSKVTSGIASLVISAVVLLAGLMLLLNALVFGLADIWTELELWHSFLIVGAIVAIIGLILYQKGKSNLSSDSLAPSRTIESVQRDKTTVQERVQ